jgi:hypothetical protein
MVPMVDSKAVDEAQLPKQDASVQVKIRRKNPEMTTPVLVKSTQVRSDEVGLSLERQVPVRHTTDTLY